MLPDLLALWILSVTVVVDGVEEMASLCGDIVCENHSNCRVTQTRFGNHVITKHDCVCAAGSTGQFCEIKFTINVGEIMSEQAKVRVSSSVEEAHLVKHKNPTQSASLTSLVYKLQYWPIDRDERISCDIIPEVTSNEYVLSGLHPGKNYVVCVSATDQDLCFENVFVSYWRNKNCAIVKTNEISVTNNNLTLASILLSVFCIIIIIVLLGLVVLARQRKDGFAYAHQRSCCGILANWICVKRQNHRIYRLQRIFSRIDTANVERESFIDDDDDNVISGRWSRNSFGAFVERNCLDLTTFRPSLNYNATSDPDLISNESQSLNMSEI